MNQSSSKFKSPNTVTVIEVQRLEWLVRVVVRMGGARTVNNLLEGNPGGAEKKKKD
jgi:hypothetical protein